MSKIKGELTAEARAYWEAIFAKEAAPGRNNPDNPPPTENTENTGDTGDTGDEQPTPAQVRSDFRTQAQRQHDALVAVGRRALGSAELGTHHGYRSP